MKGYVTYGMRFCFYNVESATIPIKIIPACIVYVEVCVCNLCVYSIAAKHVKKKTYSLAVL